MAPMRSKHQCNYQGCRNLTTERYCEPHRKATEKAYDESRGTATERGYDALWAKVRSMKLNRDPLCERCDKSGRDVPAALVHHVDRDPRNRREENLESMCLPCHVKEHRNERWGR